MSDQNSLESIKEMTYHTSLNQRYTLENGEIHLHMGFPVHLSQNKIHARHDLVLQLRAVS
jgi:hypothetical protein